MEKFHTKLKERFDLILPGVRIYFDKRDYRAPNHKDSMLRAAAASALFLPILAPAFVIKGKFTLLELEAFQRSRGEPDRIVIAELYPFEKDRPAALDGQKLAPQLTALAELVLKERNLSEQDLDKVFYALDAIAQNEDQYADERTDALAAAAGDTMRLDQQILASDRDAYRHYRSVGNAESLVDDLGYASYNALLGGKLKLALEHAEEAAKLPVNPSSDTRIDIAHAYLLNGRVSEAEKLYVASKGIPLEVLSIKEDFAIFTKLGLAVPAMEQVRKELGI